MLRGVVGELMPVNRDLPTKSCSEVFLAISFGPARVEWKVQPFAWKLCSVSKVINRQVLILECSRSVVQGINVKF